jgi:hypothetical protein
VPQPAAAAMAGHSHLSPQRSTDRYRTHRPRPARRAGAGQLQALRLLLRPGQAIDAVRVATCGSCGTAACALPGPGSVRPPALVTEYLAAGSLRSALARKAEFVRSAVVRVKLCLDTARVGGQAGKGVAGGALLLAPPPWAFWGLAAPPRGLAPSWLSCWLPRERRPGRGRQKGEGGGAGAGQHKGAGAPPRKELGWWAWVFGAALWPRPPLPARPRRQGNA